jgi:hypothetical protein
MSPSWKPRTNYPYEEQDRVAKKKKMDGVGYDSSNHGFSFGMRAYFNSKVGSKKELFIFSR